MPCEVPKTFLFFATLTGNVQRVNCLLVTLTKDIIMKVLNKLWECGLVIAIVFLAGCSWSRQARTIDIAELKRIRKSEGAQRVLISNNVRCISADDNNVWIATDRGVSRFERATNSWIHYTKEDGLSSDNINAVASDRDLVWFGTDDGVSQYNIDTGTWRTFKGKDGLKGGRVFRIAVDVHYVWFGTNSGDRKSVV